MSLADYFSSEKKLLICAASSIELGAVLSGMGEQYNADAWADWRVVYYERYSVLQTGVGKSNAAASVAAELTRASVEKRCYASVLNVGIGGALSPALKKGMVALSDAAILCDEGTPLAGEPNWRSLEDGGFAVNRFACNKSAWWHYLQGTADAVGPIATISTISGTAQIAEDYIRRSGAIAEGMEGASIALVCAQFGIDFAEIRAISNICGNSNRDENPWDFPTALSKLREVASFIRDKTKDSANAH